MGLVAAAVKCKKQHIKAKHFVANYRLFQGKTPWIDSACADCPGFWCWVRLVLGSQLYPAASDCAPELAFAAEPLGHLDMLRTAPHHLCKTWPHGTSFCNTRGHTPTIRGPLIQPQNLPKRFMLVTCFLSLSILLGAQNGFRVLAKKLALKNFCSSPSDTNFYENHFLRTILHNFEGKTHFFTELRVKFVISKDNSFRAFFCKQSFCVRG